MSGSNYRNRRLPHAQNLGSPSQSSISVQIPGGSSFRRVTRQLEVFVMNISVSTRIKEMHGLTGLDFRQALRTKNCPQHRKKFSFGASGYRTSIVCQLFTIWPGKRAKRGKCLQQMNWWLSAMVPSRPARTMSLMLCVTISFELLVPFLKLLAGNLPSVHLVAHLRRRF